ncbi:carbon-nitrogen hydrolase family protein [Streptomyces sp. NPDC003691]
MKIAAAQFAPVPGDVAANVLTAAELVRTAAGQGARVVVFPETALTGYFAERLAKEPELSLGEDDERWGPVRDACRETGTAAVVNATVRTPAGRPAITSLVFGPDGALLARYDKQHLHGVEREYFTAGTADGGFVLDGVRFALAVCYDNRFPEIARRARESGAAVYLASSVLELGNDSFEAVYPVRARENGLYVVLANALGENDCGDCRGDSGVWGPDGVRLAGAGAAPGVVVAELPL